jgi:hypothetical protein
MSGAAASRGCCARRPWITEATHTTIAFLGQCQTSGYPGVPPEATFPQVCRRALETRLPQRSVSVVTEEYQHPSELPRATDRVLRARPRVVVLEVVGWLAVKGGSEAVDLSQLPRGIRSAYDRARHFRRVTHMISTKIPEAAGMIRRVQNNAQALATGVLRPLLPRYPRPTLAEYESFVDSTVARIQRDGTPVVVQGPGAPNLALEARGIAADMPERYREVERMAQRVAQHRGALYVDRWSTITPRFYLSGSIRPHADGHTIWGNLLADELLSAGLV